MDFGYARVSTAKQDLARQLDALTAAGINTEHVFTRAGSALGGRGRGLVGVRGRGKCVAASASPSNVDKKSGATTARPGLQDALRH